jgi:hypothetical protein
MRCEGRGDGMGDGMTRIQALSSIDSSALVRCYPNHSALGSVVCALWTGLCCAHRQSTLTPPVTMVHARHPTDATPDRVWTVTRRATTDTRHSTRYTVLVQAVAHLAGTEHTHTHTHHAGHRVRDAGTGHTHDTDTHSTCLYARTKFCAMRPQRPRDMLEAGLYVWVRL